MNGAVFASRKGAAVPSTAPTLPPGRRGGASFCADSALRFVGVMWDDAYCGPFFTVF
jgi:hypothetical protein